jgi:hypothetical protein
VHGDGIVGLEGLPTQHRCPAYDCETARWLELARSERRVFVRSGELIVGVLNRATHGLESWSWFLTGVSRPHDIWQGHGDTEDAAFDDFASCWKRWLDWAGLEQLDMLERGAGDEQTSAPEPQL